MTQVFMLGAALCYLGATVMYFYEGKHWMGLTMACYVIASYALFMAGTR